MTAKSDKIKQLKQDIAENEKLIVTLKKTINQRNKSIVEIKQAYERDYRTIANSVEIIKRNFVKEFAWDELAGNPDTQLKQLKSSLNRIKKAVASDV